MINFGFVLASLSLPAVSGQVYAPYESMVEILKVDAQPSQKDPKRTSLILQFDLLPDVPKGAKIEFILKLLRTDLPIESFFFTLEDEQRKGIKRMWTPKKRLTVDKYYFMTLLRMKEQTVAVQKIMNKSSRFKPEYDPWAWNHTKKGFKVGNADMEKAEFNEFKEWVNARAMEFIQRNNEGIEELNKVMKGEAHVTAGKLDVESLKTFLTEWMKKMEKSQIAVNDLVTDDPSLYEKFIKIHTELERLGMMVARRISYSDLRPVLKKHNMKVSDLKLVQPSRFKPNYRYRVSTEVLKQHWGRIQELLEAREKTLGQEEIPVGETEEGKKDASPGNEKAKGS